MIGPPAWHAGAKTSYPREHPIGTPVPVIAGDETFRSLGTAVGEASRGVIVPFASRTAANTPCPGDRPIGTPMPVLAALETFGGPPATEGEVFGRAIGPPAWHAGAKSAYQCEGRIDAPARRSTTDALRRLGAVPASAACCIIGPPTSLMRANAPCPRHRPIARPVPEIAGNETFRSLGAAVGEACRAVIVPSASRNAANTACRCEGPISTPPLPPAPDAPRRLGAVPAPAAGGVIGPPAWHAGAKTSYPREHLLDAPALPLVAADAFRYLPAAVGDVFRSASGPRAALAPASAPCSGERPTSTPHSPRRPMGTPAPRGGADAPRRLGAAPDALRRGRLALGTASARVVAAAASRPSANARCRCERPLCAACRCERPLDAPAIPLLAADAVRYLPAAVGDAFHSASGPRAALAPASAPCSGERPTSTPHSPRRPIGTPAPRGGADAPGRLGAAPDALRRGRPALGTASARVVAAAASRPSANARCRCERPLRAACRCERPLDAPALPLLAADIFGRRGIVPGAARGHAVASGAALAGANAS